MAIIPKSEAESIIADEFKGLTDDDVNDVGTTDDADPITDDEDVDDEEDLDDDEDEYDDDDEDEEHVADDDDEEGDPAEGAAEGVDRGDGRDAKGKFATKAEADAAAAKAAEKKPEGSAAAATGKAAAPAAGTAPAEKPTFAPLKVRAAKEELEIPEAQVTRAGGYTMFAVKDADANRFMERISRGVVAEKVWRDMDRQRRELEAERSAPPRKTDEQIESEMVLEVLKPHLPELLTPLEIENLDLRVKHAQREYASTYDTDRKKHMESALSAKAPEEEQAEAANTFATHLVHLRDHPDVRDMKLSDDEIRRAYNELTPFLRSVIWKGEDGKYLVDNRLIAQQLQKIVASRTGTPDAGAPAKANTATSEAKPAAGSAKAAAAERFNRQVDSAAKPTTTSLKANRGKTGKRPRDERNTRRTDRTRDRQPVKSREQKAEDDWRAETRKFMASPTLDFPDDGSE